MMSRISLIASLFLTALPVWGQDLPPGLTGARMLPGWTEPDGSRVAAIELDLEPGWKTYWRSPGDSGLPPSFDWAGSENLADVTFHWPAPEAIRSGDSLTMGYHDRLVLPFTARPKDATQPMQLSASMEFGLCENICVPALVEMSADAPQPDRDRAITAALEDVPAQSSQKLTCSTEEIEDGIRVSVALPSKDVQLAAMELKGQPEIWVSGTEIAQEGDQTVATAEFVPPNGAPFPLDPALLTMTLVGAEGAVELQGCTPAN